MNDGPLFDSATPVKQVHFLDSDIDDEDDDHGSESTVMPSSSSPQRLLSVAGNIGASGYSDDDTTVAGSSIAPYAYPPASLKSNIQSREAEFDLDSDEIGPDDDDAHGLSGASYDDSSDEPLLRMEGLIKTNAERRMSVDMMNGRTEAAAIHDTGPPDWLSKGGGVAASIANMANSILGAGIVGLPYALREAGLFSGIVLVVVLGLVTDWTIRLIVINAKMSSQTNYIGIMDKCFGYRGRAAVSFFQFAFAFGGMCAFCVILGDTIPHVLAYILPEDPGAILTFITSRPFVIVVLTMGVSYPLSLHRDIDKLSKASALALVSMVVIVVSVAVRGPGVEEDLKGDPSERWTFLQGGFFEAAAVVSFAFVCHHNSLLIYGSLRTPTLDRFAKVTHISTAISVIACLAMSISGFLVFTDKTQGNVLNNFATDDLLINIARACFGSNMFATLPLEAFVCREVCETFFWPGQDFSHRRHVIITTALVVSAMLVSLMTCDLGLVLELAGGFSATALAYIFPASCYLVLTGKGAKHRNERLAAWVCAAFGCIVLVLSTTLSIIKAYRGDKPKQC